MTISPNDVSEDVKRQMNKPQIHRVWEKNYRSIGNERFFESAFDKLVERLGQPSNSRALDVGCGICANAIRLARRGYFVSAADYSESVLAQARDNVARQQLTDRIAIRRDDILNLSYPGNEFDLVLCWGVLMHIPDAERAIAELVRVTKPNGYIVLEELNKDAPEAIMMRLAWLARGKIKIVKNASGYEQTTQFAGETLFWRHTNIAWLRSQFEKRGCELFCHDSGMLSESYIFLPSELLKNSIHSLNRLWCSTINVPSLAYHNLLIFRKS